MVKIESVQDFEKYMIENRKSLYERAVRIEDLPEDDDWILDDSWDKLYEQEVLNGEKKKFGGFISRTKTRIKKKEDRRL